jgi:WD40 repeat protein
MKKLFITFCFGFILILPLFAGGVTESGPVYTEGEIAYIEGDVILKGEPAEFGATVHSGDTVKTGASSYCDIVFGDENVFRIHENSIAAVDFSKAEINLNAGSLSAVFNKIAGTGTGGKEAFKIRTPHTVAGVRGTVFFLKVENENSSYVCTCHGSVHYEDYKSGNEKNTEKYHHGAIRYFVDGRKIKTEEGKLLYHDDSSMEDVAKRISLKIPWGIKP